MIPGPFVGRHDTVRRLEASMVLAVCQFANDARIRNVWVDEAFQDSINDSFEAIRRQNFWPPDELA